MITFGGVSVVSAGVTGGGDGELPELELPQPGLLDSSEAPGSDTQLQNRTRSDTPSALPALGLVFSKAPVLGEQVGF